MTKKELVEELPTTRPGDRVLRRRRRPQGKWRTIAESISRFFRFTTNK